MSKIAIAILPLVFLATSCTAIKDDSGQPADEILYAAGAGVGDCSLRALGRCIYVTSAETIADGRRAKWTRHWFRMSYIGRACEQQHGRKSALFFETLFAIPHYTGIAIGNTFSVLLYPLGPAKYDAVSQIGSAELPGQEQGELRGEPPRTWAGDDESGQRSRE